MRNRGVSKSGTISWVERKPPDGVEPDAVVWVRVDTLERSWQICDGWYVGPGGTGHPIDGRYDKIGKRIRSGNPVWIPWVTLDAGDGEVDFTDGRHTFAWLRDHGVTALPVQVPPSQAASVEARFGTIIRLSTWQEDPE